MKKYLFLPTLVAMTFAGCTSSEVIEEGIQSNAIGFTNVVNKSSRAVDGDLNKNNFDNFLVYGYYTKPGMTTPIQIFNGVPVHKVVDGSTTKWTYDGTRYWIPGCTYFFYAYSCADIALAGGNGNPTFSLFDATDASVDNRALIIQSYRCDSEHQHDLVTADNESTTATDTGNKEVAFSFKHSLCKMKATFTTDFPEGYKVYVYNIRVSSFYNYADLNVGTSVWSNYKRDINNPASIAFTVPAGSYVENKAGSIVETSEAFVIPKLYDPLISENVKLHFTIRLVKIENNVENNILERSITGTWSPQWSPGNIYRYNINITGNSTGIDPIVFATNQELGSSSWSDSTQLNMEFGVDANEQTSSDV